MLASALLRESPLRPAETPDAPVLSVLPRGVERPGDRTVSEGNSLTRFSGPVPAPRARAGGLGVMEPPVDFASPAASALEHPRFAGSPQLADVASGATVLGTGSKGDGLRAVQGALLDMGFALYGGADGQYGPDTARALRNFQVHAGLRSSGVLDAATLKALEALAPAPGSRGQSRALPSPFYSGQPVRVVIALREHRTFLFDPQGQLVDIFPNAVGTAATPTHPGLKVVRAKLDQVATEDAGARLWNDRHVFGARLLDLSWADGRRSGEELHGTSAPALLGGDVSHGCIRHANEDILVLHDALAVGDRIAVVETLQDPRLGVPVTVG